MVVPVPIAEDSYTYHLRRFNFDSTLGPSIQV
jgi:hypothetical protein